MDFDWMLSDNFEVELSEGVRSLPMAEGRGTRKMVSQTATSSIYCTVRVLFLLSRHFHWICWNL